MPGALWAFGLHGGALLETNTVDVSVWFEAVRQEVTHFPTRFWVKHCNKEQTTSSGL